MVNIFDPGLALILGLLMSIVHFLGEELEEYIGDYRDQVLSFSSGASITYIFVQLMPEFHRIASESTQAIFMFPLLGFSSIHLMEKYVAKMDIEEKKMREDYREIHSAFLFFYHGAIGYLIASLIAQDAFSGLLFFLPILMHVAVSSFSINELHESLSRKKSVKIAISFAPLLGVIIYSLGTLSRQQFNPVFGTVIGMFFYVVIRDSIPEKDRGQPKEYIAGVIIYLVAILVAQII